MSVFSSQILREGKDGFTDTQAYQQAVLADVNFGHLLLPRQEDLTAGDFKDGEALPSNIEVEILRGSWEKYLKADMVGKAANLKQDLTALNQLQEHHQGIHGKEASSRIRTASAACIEPAITDLEWAQSRYFHSLQESQQATQVYQQWLSAKTSERNGLVVVSLQLKEEKEKTLQGIRATERGIQVIQQAQQNILTAGLPKKFFLNPNLEKQEKMRIAAAQIEAAREASLTAQELCQTAEDAFRTSARWVAVTEKQRMMFLEANASMVTHEVEAQEEAIDQEALLALQAALRVQRNRDILVKMKKTVKDQQVSSIAAKLSLGCRS